MWPLSLHPYLFLNVGISQSNAYSGSSGKYTVEPPLKATSPQWPPLHDGHFFYPGGQSIQLQKKPLNNGHFFQYLTKTSRMFKKFDLYGTSMFNHGNYILIVCLIVLYLYSCSKHKLSTIQPDEPCLFCHVNILFHFQSFFCVFYLDIIIYEWITIIGYRKHEQTKRGVSREIKGSIFPTLFTMGVYYL